MTDKAGVYSIKNSFDGKIYIGSTYNFRKRKLEHIRKLNKCKHFSRHLQFAWNKYGEQIFLFEIIEVIHDLSELAKAEQKWIDFYKSADDRFRYNLRPTAHNMRGFKHSDETKLKLSKANKGKKLSVDHIEKLRNANKNKIVTRETRARMGIARKKRVTSKETREKLAFVMKGNKYTIRKKDKWPHEDGIKCKCSECIAKKKLLYNQWHQNWREDRRKNGLPV